MLLRLPGVLYLSEMPNQVGHDGAALFAEGEVYTPEGIGKKGRAGEPLFCLLTEGVYTSPSVKTVEAKSFTINNLHDLLVEKVLVEDRVTIL